MYSATPPQDSEHLSSDFPILGLGIDMGGTQTRWALADQQGNIRKEGAAQGATALMLASAEGKASIQELFFFVAHQITNTIHEFGKIHFVQAGLTGFNGDSLAIKQILGMAFNLPDTAVKISNDIEVAFLDVFQPGEGYLVYAGTGSIAAYIDELEQFHRAGGHGYILDDAGSGYWIAREALKHIWREEDTHPGAWRLSPMAKTIFDQIGGHDWNQSRDFIYQSSRGEVGKLALAVAATADSDHMAMKILSEAGSELARLASAMCQRFGEKPIALSGRVQDLHPIIFATMKHNLPDNCSLSSCKNVAHHRAARIAATQTTHASNDIAFKNTNNILTI